MYKTIKKTPSLGIFHYLILVLLWSYTNQDSVDMKTTKQITENKRENLEFMLKWLLQRSVGKRVGYLTNNEETTR